MSYPRIEHAILTGFLLLTAAAGFGQGNIAEYDRSLNKLLLKKDMLQVIKEAEASLGNDLDSRFRILHLYLRAANYSKATATIGHILHSYKTVGKTTPLHHTALTYIWSTLLNKDHFNDPQIIQAYLEVDFSSEIFGKLAALCKEQTEKCDIHGIDRLIGKKIAEINKIPQEVSHKDNVKIVARPFSVNALGMWLHYRIAWRKAVGLNDKEILEEIVQGVRNDPSNVNAALLYLRFFHKPDDLRWLANTFQPERAFDLYIIGEGIPGSIGRGLVPLDDVQPVLELAVNFLQRSLEMPFSESDTAYIYSHKLWAVSIMPVIKDHEKQLRFWTKKALAETLKNAGRPQDAQPIMEELMNTDTSDISASSPSHLAGAVQAASGARVIESKILSEQAQRQDSYMYWNQRINYYEGRKEFEAVYSSYLQMFTSVPVDLSNKDEVKEKVRLINNFINFVDSAYYRVGSQISEERLKELRAEAKNFLKNEVERSSGRSEYLFGLTRIALDEGFDDIVEWVFEKHPNLPLDLVYSSNFGRYDRLVISFFENENIKPSDKEAIFLKLFELAEKQNYERALPIYKIYQELHQRNRLPRQLPKLTESVKKHLDLVKKDRNDYDYDLQSIRQKYISLLFQLYVLSNNRKAAETLIRNNTQHIYSPDIYDFISTLCIDAAKSGSIEESVYYAKLTANLDRRSVEHLKTIRMYPDVADLMRQFYTGMKENEPYSPIPDLALAELK